ncbi:MAG: hypothetical protein JL50_07595 [Peptococcaceae bacterium BICA1-7]|nr:MAG: hypothetical protein JL50_07595 [Peptococcaceae bacterium BICA1-7]HBV97895.1 tetratricopeptide repeat protein [Desulfotomaculum sp.]
MSELPMKIIKPPIIEAVKSFESSRPLKKLENSCGSMEDCLPIKTSYSSLVNMFPILVPVDSITPQQVEPPVRVKALSEVPASDIKNTGESNGSGSPWKDLPEKDTLQNRQDADGDKEAVVETQRLQGEITEAEPHNNLEQEDFPAPDPSENSTSLNGTAEQISSSKESGLQGLALAESIAENALAFWQKAVEDHPSNNIAQAYYASCLALTGRDSTDSKVIFENTIMGLSLLNRAVSRDPENHKIRLLRAYILFSLPEHLSHLTHKGIKDFQYLITVYNRDSSIFSESCYHQMLYDLGVAYHRAGKKKKAQKAWEKLLKENPDPMYMKVCSAEKLSLNISEPWGNLVRASRPVEAPSRTES